MSHLRIRRATATPVAVPIEAPLRHSVGTTLDMVRTIVQLETEEGLVGLGEIGSRVAQERIQAAMGQLVGADPFALEALRTRFARGKFYSQDAASLYAGIEMACLDLQGKAIGRPVSDLLGGRLRQAVPMIAYLFRRDSSPGHPAVATPEELVAHARDLVEQLGFSTIKLKGGSGSPWEDAEAARALRAAFPRAELRLDSNAAWPVETALRVCRALADVDLEWLEDPTAGPEGMAEVTRRGGIPTATNMCLTHAGELPRAAAVRSVDVVLCDLWYAGGVRAARELATMCEPFGMGVGVHSQTELGIGLAAMLHFAAGLPRLAHAVDAHYHHLEDDILVGGRLPIRDGTMQVPSGPGLGVEVDPDRLGRYAERYRALLARGGEAADGMPRLGVQKGMILR